MTFSGFLFFPDYKCINVAEYARKKNRGSHEKGTAILRGSPLVIYRWKGKSIRL